MIGDNPAAFGSFGDVWKGSIEGHVIAVKVLRILGLSTEDFLKVWSCPACLDL